MIRSAVVAAVGAILGASYYVEPQRFGGQAFFVLLWTGVGFFAGRVMTAFVSALGAGALMGVVLLTALPSDQVLPGLLSLLPIVVLGAVFATAFAAAGTWLRRRTIARRR